MSPDAPDISPVEHGCAYLQEWLGRLADGDLAGLPRWYTHHHAVSCRYCRVAVREIRALRHALAALQNDAPDTVPGWDDAEVDAPAPLLESLTPERRRAVFSAWQAIAAEHRV